jgi:hypothetical protein
VQSRRKLIRCRHVTFLRLKREVGV